MLTNDTHSQNFPDCFHHLWLPLHLQMRQCAPDNHVLDLVVICTLSPLRTLLLHAALLLLWLHMALSLFGFIHPCIQVCPGLLHTTPQTRMGSLQVLSSQPVMGSLCEHKCKQEKEHNREHEREQDSPPPGHLFMPPHFSHYLLTFPHSHNLRHKWHRHCRCKWQGHECGQCKGCQCGLRGGWDANTGVWCEHGHRQPQGCGGWSEGCHSPCVREIGMCILWGWVRNVSAGTIVV